MQDSIEPVKILLTDIMHGLKLKDKPFSVFSAASESDMKELWLELEQIDQSLLFNEKHRKKDLPNFPQLVSYLSHCCQVRHYSFTIKKCGVSSCSLRRPVRMPQQAFDTLSKEMRVTTAHSTMSLEHQLQKSLGQACKHPRVSKELHVCPFHLVCSA